MSKTTVELIDEARKRLAQLEEMERIANLPIEPGEIRVRLDAVETYLVMLEERVSKLIELAYVRDKDIAHAYLGKLDEIPFGRK